MTSTRQFGRCPVGGCPTRAVVTGAVIEQGLRGDRLRLPLYWTAEGVVTDSGTAFCEVDGFPIKWKGLKATTNTAECGPRCHESTAPVCKCSCGGAHHGELA